MLQYKSLYPETLGLLKSLSENELISDFSLVGGTAIALYLGHRISIDLDFFSPKSFNSQLFHGALKMEYTLENSIVDINTISTNILTANQSVKVELITYQYPLIRPINTIDGIRLMSLEDLAAMKLSAITGRGAKKDFVDIYYLLDRFSLSDMFGFYLQKYSEQNLFQLMKSIVYFKDADMEPDPNLILGVNWMEIKGKIIQEVKKIA